MHRVELKGKIAVLHPFLLRTSFLMHRVELKDFLGRLRIPLPPLVPNAPCGVESGLVLKTLKNKMGVGCNVF